MKAELKRELFQSAINLCTYVNEHQITDEDSIYIESQTDIDSYYWDTLGEIIYQQHLKSLYR